MQFHRRVFWSGLQIFPGLLENPYGCTDEIFRAARNPQIFVEHENIMLLKFAKVRKASCPGACVFALCKSRMDSDTPCYIAGIEEASCMMRMGITVVWKFRVARSRV
ncbi:MAG: hypothetical protein DMF37_05120 [Verrucomicrobia bacterium]|nr:MAG: hypothetical protein DMF37_05120 [Verrucomicrobiota bacterium]